MLAMDQVSQDAQQKPQLQPPTTTTKNVIAGRFCMEYELGRTRLGVVHGGHTTDAACTPIAIKVESALSQTPSLLHEYGMYEVVRKYYAPQSHHRMMAKRRRVVPDVEALLPIPRALYCGTSKQECVMVTELAEGGDLNSAFEGRNCSFDDEILAYCAIQMLARVRELHAVGLVHADIKAANFVTCTRQERLLLIDLGFAAYWKNLSTRKHVEKKAKDFSGTLPFASPHAHAFHTLSRRDDLISLAYVLFYLWRNGQLPWYDRTALQTKANASATTPPLLRTPEEQRVRIVDIGRQKRTVHINSLATHPTSGARAPAALCNFYSHAIGLAFDEDPDYDYLAAQLDAWMCESAAVSAEDIDARF
jgi:serine/threonine protein kinase